GRAPGARRLADFSASWPAAYGAAQLSAAFGTDARRLRRRRDHLPQSTGGFLTAVRQRQAVCRRPGPDPEGRAGTGAAALRSRRARAGYRVAVQRAAAGT